MKRVQGLLLIMWFSLSCPLKVIANEVLTLDIGDWAPYTSENASSGKIAEMIIKEAFALEGLAVRFRYFPWARSYENVQKGQAIGTFPWYSTEQRRAEMLFNTVPIVEEKQVFFHLKSTAFDWKEYADLKRYKIGGTVGYNHMEILEKEGLKLDPVRKEELNFQKLLLNRIDLYPSGILVGYNLVSELFPPAQAALFTNHPKSISEAPMYMLFTRTSDKSQGLADALDRGLKKLIHSVRRDEIIAEQLGVKLISE